ncbi:MAG TPA: hypothetical protein VMK42_15885 [Anaeromyxobacteraceae bacterium]|nr:hypothetical protein [Anaeromyxobacteraceae bacterium]
MDGLKVMLAVHVYGDVCGETVQCLVSELRREERDLRWDVVFPASDALVSRLRSEIVTRAIQGGHDVLVWLDHDMVWAPGDLAGLVKRCAEVKGVVGGLIPFRAEWMFGRGFPWRPAPGTRVADVQLGQDRLVPAEKVGGGFVAFWVPALARMVEALEKSPDPALKVSRCRSAVEGFFWDVCRPVAVPYGPGEEWQNYLSEDWALLMRLAACEVKVFAWTKPLIRHVGRKAYSVADALGIVGPADDIEAHVRSTPGVVGPWTPG